MFAILDKANPDTENIRDLNLAVVRHMIVQVIKLVLQPELLLIGHNLLYRACTKRGLIYIYIYIYIVHTLTIDIYHAIICKLIRQTQCLGV
jgi:hypothetical protein